MKIRLLPANQEFEQRPDESLLQAALRAGVALDYNCANGACGLCKARRVSGDFVKVHHHDAVLSESERAQGYLLLCCYAAVGEAVIETGAASDPRDIPPQTIDARVRKVESLPGNTLILHLRTPRSQTLHYLAGQRVTLTLSDGTARTLAVASCPCDPMNLQFHLREADDPAFCARARTLRISEAVNVTGPTGSFVFTGNSSPAITFVAVESGFAPVKSLLEHVLALELPQPVRLIWLVRNAEGLYLNNYCRSLGDALENFTYVPLVVPELAQMENSAQSLDAALRPALGRIAATEDGDFYIAAPATLASALTALLRQHGAAPGRLHVEPGGG